MNLPTFWPAWHTCTRGASPRLAALASFVLAPAALLLPACQGDDPNTDFAITARTPSAALMAVHGTSSEDVWMVGADDGNGPLVLHFDGRDWTRAETGSSADLWWVHSFAEDRVFFAGSDATILSYDGEKFVRERTPGLGRSTVYGLWGAAPDDVYAVGSVSGRNGFIWHFDGSKWTELPLPSDLPRDVNNDVPALLKVSGRTAHDVMVVGDKGVVLRGNADDGFEVIATDTDERLFTVDCEGELAVIVGGSSTGLALEEADGELAALNVASSGVLQGVDVGPRGTIWLTGEDGLILSGRGHRVDVVDPGIDIPVESLHSVWIDPSGGVWAVGGNVLSGTLDAGIGIHLGKAVPPYEEPTPAAPPEPTCPEEEVDPKPGGSMAQRWNQQLLGAVRRDLPRPTVHARNLFHHSLALWDIWASFDETAQGVLYQQAANAGSPAEVEAAREEAMAYASYRILSSRYEHAIGGPVSVACFGALMNKLGYDPALTGTGGSSARALGNRVAKLVLDTYADDGSGQASDYADPKAYEPAGPPLIVDEPGTYSTDPLLWQQLVLAEAVTQNGISQGAGVRAPVGTHWGEVTPFALQRTRAEGPYFETDMAPTTLGEDLLASVVDVIVKSSELDHEDGVMMDISPGAYGNNPLGTNDGTGHPENPVTGEPYESNLVPRGDFTRVLAEFWADGPKSETPPGHWNTLANDIADLPDAAHRLFGAGPPLDRLAWDVHVYLALNGALHDAAIAAWELKRYYETARPITLVRYFGGLGQNSDPGGPSYHPDGLPLIDGIIEVITEESSAPGERHAHLARYTGELTLRSWRGEPGDRETEIGGVAWVRAIEWLPYQRRNFVTPAFPGYVSGHSTFSRAGAEVLATLTGSPYFPGGLGSYSFEPGYLVFEYGPSVPVRLEWATYYDAADQAGQSRLWGGIHIRNDDLDGRIIGAQIGRDAVDLARRYFEGSAE